MRVEQRKTKSGEKPTRKELMKKQLKFKLDIQKFAEVTTVDVTTIIGSDKFPVNTNDVYKLVETIAVQNIRSLKSSNRIEDAFYDYVVDNGTVIEEAVVAMAEAQEFVKTGQPDLSPVDPKLFVKYFNNWETKQFETAVRKSDIRKIIANKGTGFDELVAQILATLSEGESYHDYTQMRLALEACAEDSPGEFVELTGRKPLNAKGILWAIRETYNMLKATNTIGIEKPSGMSEADFAKLKQATPVEDIRIAISESILNLIDVTELANVFNLEKEELFGKLVVLPYEKGDTELGEFTIHNIVVYDRKHLGRGTRLFEYSQDVIGKGLYTNHYLTTERCYFRNFLYKCVKIEVADAISNALGDVSEVK